jgi:hypothetical protein
MLSGLNVVEPNLADDGGRCLCCLKGNNKGQEKNPCPLFLIEVNWVLEIYRPVRANECTHPFIRALAF